MGRQAVSLLACFGCQRNAAVPVDLRPAAITLCYLWQRGLIAVLGSHVEEWCLLCALVVADRGPFYRRCMVKTLDAFLCAHTSNGVVAAMCCSIRGWSALLTLLLRLSERGAAPFLLWKHALQEAHTARVCVCRLNNGNMRQQPFAFASAQLTEGFCTWSEWWQPVWCKLHSCAAGVVFAGVILASTQSTVLTCLSLSLYFSS